MLLLATSPSRSLSKFSILPAKVEISRLTLPSGSIREGLDLPRLQQSLLCLNLIALELLVVGMVMVVTPSRITLLEGVEVELNALMVRMARI